MTAKPKFYVETQLAGDFCKQWVKQSWWGSVGSAVDNMRRLRIVKDGGSDYVFKAVRIRYRGWTIDKMSNY